MTSPKGGSGGKHSGVPHHYHQYHHHAYRNTPNPAISYPYPNFPPSSSSSAPPPALPSSSSSSLQPQQHPRNTSQYYISQSHHANSASGGSCATTNALKKSERFFAMQLPLTQRQRQDWFRCAPKHYAQSYDTSFFNHYFNKNISPPTHHHHHYPPLSHHLISMPTTSKRVRHHRNHYQHHHPSENNDDEEYGDIKTDTKDSSIYREQPYYPTNAVPPTSNYWPNTNTLTAALNAAEAAAYDYQKKYVCDGVNYNELIPPSSWFERNRTYDEASANKLAYEKSLSKSQPQFWWDQPSSIYDMSTTGHPTTPAAVSQPFQVRVNSRRDTFVNQIQRAKTHVPIPIATATTTAANNSTTSTDVNSDYRPVTKYIIEDEDAYVISNGGYVPIFGGGLKRTTSV